MEMTMHNIKEVVDAYLKIVDCKIDELTEQKLYKIIMLAYAQGEGKSINAKLAKTIGTLQ